MAILISMLPLLANAYPKQNSKIIFEIPEQTEQILLADSYVSEPLPQMDLVQVESKSIPTIKPRAEAVVVAQNRAPHTEWQEGQWAGWCVEFAKKYTGRFGTWGHGGRNLPITQTPQVGAVVVFNYIHVAVIKDIQGDTLFLIESNYQRRMRVSTRTISMHDPSIKGYWMPN